MAQQIKQSAKIKQSTLHPGSSVQDAKAIGGKGDFGVPENNVIERTYTSQNTKRSDPGAAVARAGEDGSRTAGVGGLDSGPGSSSGGDLDADIIGIGTGVGIATSGSIHEPMGADEAPQSGRNGKSPATVVQPKLQRDISGSTVQLPDDRSVAGQGADAASQEGRDDDSFAGEVSTDEASGRNDA